MINIVITAVDSRILPEREVFQISLNIGHDVEEDLSRTEDYTSLFVYGQAAIIPQAET